MEYYKKYGIFAGLSTILLLGCIYFYSVFFLTKQLMVHPYVTFGRFLVYAIFMYLSIKTFLKLSPGEKPFKELIKPAFVCFLIANLVFYVFYYIMFKWLDPDLMEASNKYMADYFEKQDVKLQPGKREVLTTDSQSIGLSSTIFAYVREIILGFIIAAILSIFRRNA